MRPLSPLRLRSALIFDVLIAHDLLDALKAGYGADRQVLLRLQQSRVIDHLQAAGHDELLRQLKTGGAIAPAAQAQLRAVLVSPNQQALSERAYLAFLMAHDVAAADHCARLVDHMLAQLQALDIMPLPDQVCARLGPLLLQWQSLVARLALHGEREAARTLQCRLNEAVDGFKRLGSGQSDWASMFALLLPEAVDRATERSRPLLEVPPYWRNDLLLPLVMRPSK